MTPVPAGESSERENFANRKLIRPTLPRAENHGNHNSAPMPVQERRERPGIGDPRHRAGALAATRGGAELVAGAGLGV